MLALCSTGSLKLEGLGLRPGPSDESDVRFRGRQSEREREREGSTKVSQLETSEFCWFISVCMLSHSVVSDSLRLHGLWPFRLLCPWDFPSKNTGVGLS